MLTHLYDQRGVEPVEPLPDDGAVALPVKLRDVVVGVQGDDLQRHGGSESVTCLVSRLRERIVGLLKSIIRVKSNCKVINCKKVSK